MALSKTSIRSITSSDPMSTPARVQINPDEITDSDKPQQVGSAQFNIWWTNRSKSSNQALTKLKHRVRVARDEGYTKACKGSPICLFFSQGCCYLGSKCSYFHRLPKETDNFKPTQDCFGRDKTANYRDDMDGVGSFNKKNCTLYVGGFHMRPNIESLLSRNFEEFGKVTKIRVLKNKNCAFITMETEHRAQFAKEAMQKQSLHDGSQEVLSVRWASEDKNPEAQEQEKRRMEELAMDTVRQLLGDQDSKKRKVDAMITEDEVQIDVVEVEEEIAPVTQRETANGDSKDHADVTNGNHATTIAKQENNGILRKSTLQQVSKFKRLLMFKRHEPHLESVLGNYSSDEDDE
ncbi:Pre-mRNA-splicing factor CWC2 [Candida viswanathii]|uniref:Pre-mRNA-splicing factor CWC2 n=1 Tax=Candida viswanathii TaxID=5486 RepID=A0A367XRL5_9ASCO|nr:Pre-mRNA-splicing factor CWC2 [Candida viswanathii]